MTNYEGIEFAFDDEDDDENWFEFDAEFVGKENIIVEYDEQEERNMNKNEFNKSNLNVKNYEMNKNDKIKEMIDVMKKMFKKIENGHMEVPYWVIAVVAMVMIVISATFAESNKHLSDLADMAMDCERQYVEWYMEQTGMEYIPEDYEVYNFDNVTTWEDVEIDTWEEISEDEEYDFEEEGDLTFVRVDENGYWEALGNYVPYEEYEKDCGFDIPGYGMYYPIEMHCEWNNELPKEEAYRTMDVFVDGYCVDKENYWALSLNYGENAVLLNRMSDYLLQYCPDVDDEQYFGNYYDDNGELNGGYIIADSDYESEERKEAYKFANNVAKYIALINGIDG